MYRNTESSPTSRFCEWLRLRFDCLCKSEMTWQRCQALVVGKLGYGIKDWLPVLCGNAGQWFPVCWDHTARWNLKSLQGFAKHGHLHLPSLPPFLSWPLFPFARLTGTYSTTPLSHSWADQYLSGCLPWGPVELWKIISIGDFWPQALRWSKGPSEDLCLGSACMCTRQRILHP